MYIVRPVVLGLALLGMLCLITACGSNSASSQANKSDKQAIPVEVASVKSGNIEALFSGTATLEVENEAEVVAKVGGVVANILAEEGTSVHVGQILAKLDDERLAVLVAQAEANLRKLENDFDRNKALFDRKLISAEEFQGSKFEFESQKAAYELARLDLDYASIKAPINGVIAERRIKVGNMVLANQVTFKITGFDPLRAVIYVPEKEISKLSIGQIATLSVDALESEQFPGAIDMINPVVDPSSGTVKVTLGVRNPKGRLKPGMFVRANVIYDTHENALLIPKDAILSEDAESAVFVVEDSLVYRRVVQVGFSNKSHFEVNSGIKLGDIVVTAGQGSLKDSARVQVIQQ